jgi:CBS domain containing-hemolysin-like protein
MLLLVIYVLIALGFSFLCSIAEAVILSVTTPHIMLLKKQGKRVGAHLEKLKADINSPLAAILTLNTIAHTVGAAGAGAQATKVFGDAYIGVASAVLTLLILVFSEIIPKTLGAHYWKQLAPATAYALKSLIWLLRPFVWLSAKLTAGLTHGPGLKGFNRQELEMMADLSHAEGHLGPQERRILKNLLRLHEGRVTDAMTPRTVIFSAADTQTVDGFLAQHMESNFSRIPLHQGEPGEIEGFVLRGDLLLARLRGDGETTLATFRRELPAVPESSTLIEAFNELVRKRSQMLLVIDEYGTVDGLLTLEDILETLLGLEIVDENDTTVDMQELARRLWHARARGMGIATDG